MELLESASAIDIQRSAIDFKSLLRDVDSVIEATSTVEVGMIFHPIRDTRPIISDFDDAAHLEPPIDNVKVRLIPAEMASSVSELSSPEPSEEQEEVTDSDFLVPEVFLCDTRLPEKGTPTRTSGGVGSSFQVRVKMGATKTVDRSSPMLCQALNDLANRSISEMQVGVMNWGIVIRYWQWQHSVIWQNGAGNSPIGRSRVKAFSAENQFHGRIRQLSGTADIILDADYDIGESPWGWAESGPTPTLISCF